MEFPGPVLRVLLRLSEAHAVAMSALWRHLGLQASLPPSSLASLDAWNSTNQLGPGVVEQSLNTT